MFQYMKLIFLFPANELCHQLDTLVYSSLCYVILKLYYLVYYIYLTFTVTFCKNKHVLNICCSKILTAKKNNIL